MNKKINNYLDSWYERMDDWSDYLLPSAVNEAKQMVNSKVFSSVFLFGIVFFLFIALFLFLVPTDENSGPYGFLFFSGIMDVGLILLIPSMLFQNMTNERGNGSFELMSITSITPLKIVLGKWQTGLMQSIVFGSIVVPGIIFSYFFRGIPISLIFVGLFITLFASQLSILAAIFFCSLGTLRASRIFLQLVASVTYLTILIFTIGIKQDMARDDNILLNLFTTDFALALVFIVPFVITLECFLISISVGQLSSYVANKSTWPRIFYSLLVLEVGILPFFMDFHREVYELFVDTIFVHCVISFFFFMEKDVLTKKLYLQTEKSKYFFKTIFFKLFYPGKSSAFLLFNVQSAFLWFSFCFYLEGQVSSNGNYPSELMTVSFGGMITYMSLIYLVLACIHKFYPHSKIILMLFAILFISVIFFLVPVIFYYKYRYNDMFYVMNIFYHLGYNNSERLYLGLNLSITSMVLIPTLMIASKLNKRKVEVIRNFIAGERG